MYLVFLFSYIVFFFCNIFWSNRAICKIFPKCLIFLRISFPFSCKYRWREHTYTLCIRHSHINFANISNDEHMVFLPASLHYTFPMWWSVKCSKFYASFSIVFWWACRHEDCSESYLCFVSFLCVSVSVYKRKLSFKGYSFQGYFKGFLDALLTFEN